MIIKCPNCGYDNQLGSIFCRGCGEKLDVERLRPKVEKSRDAGGGIFGVVRRIITLTVFLGLLAVIGLMFYPLSDSLYPVLDENGQKEAKAKFESLNKKVNDGFGNDTYVLTAPELTFLYNDAFVAKSSGASAAYNIEKVIFDVDSQGYMHVVLRAKLGGKVPVTLEIKGILTNRDTHEAGSISAGLNVTEARIGHMISVPIQFVTDRIVEKFQIVYMDEKVDKILRAISKAEIDDSRNIIIKF